MERMSHGREGILMKAWWLVVMRANLDMGEEEEQEDGEKYNGDSITVCSAVAEC
jgi:hypothetical protein